MGGFVGVWRDPSTHGSDKECTMESVICNFLTCIFSIFSRSMHVCMWGKTTHPTHHHTHTPIHPPTPMGWQITKNAISVELTNIV